MWIKNNDLSDGIASDADNIKDKLTTLGKVSYFVYLEISGGTWNSMDLSPEADMSMPDGSS